MPADADAAPDLLALAAQHRAVLKDEPATLVELLGHGTGAVVCKTYRNSGLRWLQSCLRLSRARREHDNLRAVAAAGVPCTLPLGCSERRRHLGVVRSQLVTRFLPDCKPVKTWLQLLPRPRRERQWLVQQMGRLLAAMHRHGLLWCTPMPRNFLLQGLPGSGRLLVCDVPALVRFPRPIDGSRAALLDLFDAVASPSRRRDFSRQEQLRYLRAYCGGDRARARQLLAALWRRSAPGQRLRKNLVMAARTYVLAPWRRRQGSAGA